MNQRLQRIQRGSGDADRLQQAVARSARLSRPRVFNGLDTIGGGVDGVDRWDRAFVLPVEAGCIVQMVNAACHGVVVDLTGRNVRADGKSK